MSLWILVAPLSHPSAWNWAADGAAWGSGKSGWAQELAIEGLPSTAAPGCAAVMRPPRRAHSGRRRTGRVVTSTHEAFRALDRPLRPSYDAASPAQQKKTKAGGRPKSNPKLHSLAMCDLIETTACLATDWTAVAKMVQTNQRPDHRSRAVHTCATRFYVAAPHVCETSTTFCPKKNNQRTPTVAHSTGIYVVSGLSDVPLPRGISSAAVDQIDRDKIVLGSL